MEQSGVADAASDHRCPCQLSTLLCVHCFPIKPAWLLRVPVPRSLLNVPPPPPSPLRPLVGSLCSCPLQQPAFLDFWQEYLHAIHHLYEEWLIAGDRFSVAAPVLVGSQNGE